MHLKERRKQKGFTAKALTAQYPGMDKHRYSPIENGRYLPTVEFMRYLCQKLDCTPLQLYEKEEIDLAGLGRPKTALKKEHRKRPCKMTFRVSEQVRTALTLEVFDMCGYSTQQSWFDDCVRRLLGEYAIKKWEENT